ncbi:bL33m [Diplonema papillatum]|nr:bL33m [Diplonema papillatum]|eukprot:gene10138-15587_t
MDVLRLARRIPLGARCFSSTAPLLWAWPKRWHAMEGGNRQLMLSKYSQKIKSTKRELVPIKLMSAAGHPWYHISARRKVAKEPDRRTQVMYDPVVQRPVLFHEKKHTSMANAKKKWTQ